MRGGAGPGGGWRTPILIFGSCSREAAATPGRRSLLVSQDGRHTLNTFITSSPRWLITVTATRPFFGLSNGRDVSLLRLDQAAASISA